MSDSNESDAAEENGGIIDSPVSQNTYVFVYIVAIAASVLIFGIYW
jgi:hypothetical protein